ncbi:hypothetical protein PIB30_060326 [Stylosanthes scabra]|uniref:Uncharacterized protein n=1 Tax=Stylosanthes scabra TaxID=79078 RepID=A0ABU6VLH7_9FABA|nr:hypothetical protein [Stylosanthes scabra]
MLLRISASPPRVSPAAADTGSARGFALTDASDTAIGYRFCGTAASWYFRVSCCFPLLPFLNLKVKQMENFTKEEQVIVYFEGEQAIGDAEGLLAGYLGLLAIDCKSFPISFRK